MFEKRLSLFVLFFVTDKTTPEYVEGNPFWLSREEYVLFGCESLEQ